MNKKTTYSVSYSFKSNEINELRRFFKIYQNPSLKAIPDTSISVSQKIYNFLTLIGVENSAIIIKEKNAEPFKYQRTFTFQSYDITLLSIVLKTVHGPVFKNAKKNANIHYLDMLNTRDCKVSCNLNDFLRIINAGFSLERTKSNVVIRFERE